MKKFILAMVSLSFLAGCGSYLIVNLSGEEVTVNEKKMENTCEEVSYSVWGLFGDWPVEIKVGEGESKTWDDRKDYTVHPGGEVKEATKKELEQCEKGTEESAIKTATKAATDAAADLNAKVEEYKTAKAHTASQNPSNPDATAETQTAAQEAEAAALSAAQEAAQAATEAAEAAREAAEQKEVDEEDKTAAEAAAAEAEKAVEDAKTAGVGEAAAQEETVTTS